MDVKPAAANPLRLSPYFSTKQYLPTDPELPFIEDLQDFAEMTGPQLLVVGKTSISTLHRL